MEPPVSIFRLETRVLDSQILPYTLSFPLHPFLGSLLPESPSVRSRTLHCPSHFHKVSALSLLPMSCERCAGLDLLTFILISSYFPYHSLNFQERFLMFWSSLHFIAPCSTHSSKHKNHRLLLLSPFSVAFLPRFNLVFIFHVRKLSFYVWLSSAVSSLSRVKS